MAENGPEDGGSLSGGLTNEDRERNLIVIPWIAQKVVLPKFDKLGLEDAIVLVSILIEIGQLKATDLLRRSGTVLIMIPHICTIYVEPDGTYFLQIGHFYSRFETQKETKRISTLRIGRVYDTFWEFWRNFHVQHVYNHLARLDGLTHLLLQACEPIPPLPDCMARFLIPEGIALGIPSSTNTKNLKLETLHLPNYTIENEEDLARILFDVLPFYPNLTKLSVGGHCGYMDECGGNKIKSFQSIAQRIQTSTNDDNNNDNDNEDFERTPSYSSSRIRHLDLGKFFLAKEKQHKERIEADALKSLLTHFKELHHIDGAFGYRHLRDHPCASDVGLDYLMEVNNVGRALVEAKENTPLSLWPNVLERAWKRNCFAKPDKGQQADGIYFLLRNVQALKEGSKRRTVKK